MKIIELEKIMPSKYMPNPIGCILTWLISLIAFFVNPLFGFFTLCVAIYHTYMLVNLEKVKHKYLLNFGIYTLKFDGKNVVCGTDETIYWHIAYNRLESVKKVKVSSFSLIRPLREECYIYTNDNDSYIFPFEVSNQSYSEIVLEIEKVKKL